MLENLTNHKFNVSLHFSPTVLPRHPPLVDLSPGGPLRNDLARYVDKFKLEFSLFFKCIFYPCAFPPSSPSSISWLDSTCTVSVCPCLSSHKHPSLLSSLPPTGEHLCARSELRDIPLFVIDQTTG